MAPRLSCHLSLLILYLEMQSESKGTRFTLLRLCAMFSLSIIGSVVVEWCSVKGIRKSRWLLPLTSATNFNTVQQTDSAHPKQMKPQCNTKMGVCTESGANKQVPKERAQYFIASNSTGINWDAHKSHSMMTGPIGEDRLRLTAVSPGGLGLCPPFT
ncbi:hypothetical protein C8R43DRAFT_947863 [Mycena crocata]|nr:hypothetical protein C8R43DRAFT_947863 [Mycena crocata]